jgi:hypothetical protein
MLDGDQVMAKAITMEWRSVAGRPEETSPASWAMAIACTLEAGHVHDRGVREYRRVIYFYLGRNHLNCHTGNTDFLDSGVSVFVGGFPTVGEDLQPVGADYRVTSCDLVVFV